MTLHKLLIPAAAGLALLLVGCSPQGSSATVGESARQEPAHSEAATTAMPSGTVVEVIGASSYTYLRVDTGQGELWLAAPQFAVAAGDRVVWAPGTPMSGWRSETLDRTWDEVQFISQIQVEGAEAVAGALPPGHPPATVPTLGVGADIEKLEGGLTVAEIHSQAGQLSGQQVALRGRVVKANFGIMGSNWLHVQDGSGEAATGTNDLTVTTQGGAAVGDLVELRGVLATDKDFGAGYRYPVIVENAEVVIEPGSAD